MQVLIECKGSQIMLKMPFVVERSKSRKPRNTTKPQPRCRLGKFVVQDDSRTKPKNIVKLSSS